MDLMERPLAGIACAFLSILGVPHVVLMWRNWRPWHNVVDNLVAILIDSFWARPFCMKFLGLYSNLEFERGLSVTGRISLGCARKLYKAGMMFFLKFASAFADWRRRYWHRPTNRSTSTEVLLSDFGPRRTQVLVFLPNKSIPAENSFEELARGTQKKVRSKETNSLPPLVIHIHGGGMHLGSTNSETPLCCRLRDDLGAVVCSIGYRLAPEHPFPASLDDVVDTTEFILKNPGHFARLVLAAANSKTFFIAKARTSPDKTEPTDDHLAVDHRDDHVFDTGRIVGIGYSAGAYLMCQLMLHLGSSASSLDENQKYGILGHVLIAPWVHIGRTPSRDEYFHTAIGWNGLQDVWAWGRMFSGLLEDGCWDTSLSLEEIHEKFQSQRKCNTDCNRLTSSKNRFPISPLVAASNSIAQIAAPAYVCIFEYDVCRDGGLWLAQALESEGKLAGSNTHRCSHVPLTTLPEVYADVKEALTKFLQV